MMIVNNNRPKRDFDGVGQVGLKAHKLATQHQVEIDKRVPPGLLVQLVGDLGALGVAVPAAIVARAEKTTATSDRTFTLAQAIAMVGGIRETVRTAKAPLPVRQAYGVGMSLNPRLPATVLAGLSMIQKRIAEHPEEITEFCFASEDLAAIQSMSAEAASVSETQKDKRASAPAVTKDRNVIANRILAAARRIRAAGLRAFAANPVVLADFTAIRTSPPQKKGKAATAKTPPKKAAEPTPKPAATTTAKPAEATTPPATPAMPAATPTTPAPSETASTASPPAPAPAAPTASPTA